ncbi:MAG: hypothetical protein U1E17_08425 [Geminicoccaceae bacterium]
MLFTYEEIAVEVDEAGSVPCLLELEPNVDHMAIIHGSGRNNAQDRRIGYSITYLAHVRHSGKRGSAILVRGEDRFGHFRPDPAATREMDPEICAFDALWRQPAGGPARRASVAGFLPPAGGGDYGLRLRHAHRRTGMRRRSLAHGARRHLCYARRPAGAERQPCGWVRARGDGHEGLELGAGDGGAVEGIVAGHRRHGRGDGPGRNRTSSSA